MRRSFDAALADLGSVSVTILARLIGMDHIVS